MQTDFFAYKSLKMTKDNCQRAIDNVSVSEIILYNII